VQPTKQALFIWYLILSSAWTLSRPDLNDLGSGSHVHLSLWENDQNVFMGSTKDNFHGMSKTGAQFLAGVYHHLPSILAFTAPHPNR
jgi:glutamine synthetase